MDDLRLNINQAALKMGVSRRLLYYWMAQGMPYTTTKLGSRLIAASDLADWSRINWKGRPARGSRGTLPRP